MFNVRNCPFTILGYGPPGGGGYGDRSDVGGNGGVVSRQHGFSDNQLIRILEVIHEMDQNLRISRTRVEEKLFYKRLKMCVSMARGLATESQTEKSNLLVQCYLQIIATQKRKKSQTRYS